jgi:hypothetical protein
MSVTSAARIAGTYQKSWRVKFTADADTTATIAHGFTATPDKVELTPLSTKGAQMDLSATWDGTNVVVTKGNTGTGAGDASDAVEVFVTVLHTLTK